MKISRTNIVQSCTYILIAILILAICLVPGCENQKPIKIGFAGTFTGRHYDLGISGRNGAILAVEEANKKGGIKGRKIELIAKDDKYDPQVALSVDRELIDQGVIAIVGHMTSEISKAVLPLINEKKIVMISPTAASPLLDGIDDYFIKVNSTSRDEALKNAGFAYHNLNIRRISAVYDSSNKAYAQEWLSAFKSDFEGLGGRVVSTITFNSNENPSFLELARRLLASRPHGIVIIANALDTAHICQQIRKINPNTPILSSLWGMTIDILSHGGKAVENVVFSHIFNPADSTQQYLDFKKNYIERFGREPDFAAVKSYDAINIILSSIQNSKDMADLKKAILKKKKFKGLQGDFEIDEYGDAQNKTFLITIKENKFVAIE